jgi:4-hydroxybenzoate polyprenyltransferase
MQEREARIRAEIERERGLAREADTLDHRRRMASAFQASRRRSKATPDLKTPLLRLGILLFLAMFLIAYLTWGKPVLYSLVAVVPVYFYLRLKSTKRKS